MLLTFKNLIVNAFACLASPFFKFVLRVRRVERLLVLLHDILTLQLERRGDHVVVRSHGSASSASLDGISNLANFPLHTACTADVTSAMTVGFFIIESTEPEIPLPYANFFTGASFTTTKAITCDLLDNA